MPVPSSITDLSKIASDNSPQGTETVKGTIDDYLRTHGAFIRQLADLAGGPTVTLASSATVSIGFAQSSNVLITGTTAIASFDVIAEGTLRWVTFAGALTLAHNAASMQLPGSANILTAAGDAALFKSLGGGNWKCLDYVRASGTGVVQATNLVSGYLSAADWNTFNGKQGALGFTPVNKAGDTISGPGTPLVVNSTTSTALKIALASAGVTQGYIATDGTYAFRVADATNSRYVLSVSNAGIASAPGMLAFGPGAPLTVSSSDSTPLKVLLQDSGATRGYLAADATYPFRVVNAANSTFVMSVDNSGNFSAPVITQTSDERKKKLWQRLPHDFVAQLAGLKKSGLFTWRKGCGAGVGVGAQSLERILPTAVHTDETGAKTVNYGAAAMVSAVELARMLMALEKRLAALEAK